MKTLKAPITVGSILIIASLSGTALSTQDWQERRLLTPTANQQRMEQQGRVYIYDGLHEETVDRALDTQFDRVENMMFIGVKRTTVDGRVSADDDC